MAANGIPEIPTAPGRTGSGSKPLVIGGARGGTVLLIIMAAIGFLLLACGESGPPSPDSTLHLVPEDAEEIGIFDVVKISAEPALAEEFPVGFWVEGIMETLADTEEFSLVTLEGGVSVFLYKGPFEFEDLRDEMEDNGREASSYRGYEVWGEIGLLEEAGYVIVGDSQDAVEEILWNLYREEGHLAGAEDNDLKRILDEVGNGLLVYANVAEDECTIRRCQGVGTLISGYDADREEISGKFVLLFSSERAAESAADDYDEVADYMKEHSEGTDIISMESDGEFVIVAFTDDIEEDDTARAEEPAPTATFTPQMMPAARPAAPEQMQQPVTDPVAEVPNIPAPTTRSLEHDDWFQDCTDNVSRISRQGISSPTKEIGTIEKNCQCILDYMIDRRPQDGPRRVSYLLDNANDAQASVRDPFIDVGYSAISRCVG